VPTSSEPGNSKINDVDDYDGNSERPPWRPFRTKELEKGKEWLEMLRLRFMGRQEVKKRDMLKKKRNTFICAVACFCESLLGVGGQFIETWHLFP